MESYDTDPASDYERQCVAQGAGTMDGYPDHSPTLQDVASDARHWFMTGARTNGDVFVRLKDNAPEWVHDIVKAAHSNRLIGGSDGLLFSDDFTYETTLEALQAISEMEYTSDLDDLELEASIYTHELVAWLGSRNDRGSYVDEAQEEYSIEAGTLLAQRLQLGQAYEKREILQQVLTELQKGD